MYMNIFIGGAWPYANGPLHIGHLAALLPGDVLARYHRLKGDNVIYVSGSDCYGTPVAIRARQEGTTPAEVCGHFHEEFCECFKKLGFSYDLYGRTTSDEHRSFVREFHRQLYQSDLVYEAWTSLLFCPCCEKILTDRLVAGTCPSCGKKTRGDQCDACGRILEAETLIAPVCTVCGKGLKLRRTKHLYIALSRLEDTLREYIGAHPRWRKNALSFSCRYLNEGLQDRALTRDLDWGIEVPRPGYAAKKIYIWAENVLGYLSACKTAAEARGSDFLSFWQEDSRHYYVHGKDNIPFHTLILPALLLAHGGTQGALHGGGWHLPDEIVSSEHLTLDGRKISTSQNHAIWVTDLLERFEPDSLRYFLIANGPEKRDADFTWQEYTRVHNDELLGAWGNFVHRTLAFISKYFGGAVPGGTPDESLVHRIAATFDSAGLLLEQMRFRDALECIFSLVRQGNKYFDAAQPWRTRETEPDKCAETLYNCVFLILNLERLLSPFLPFTSSKIDDWLQAASEKTWSLHFPADGLVIPQPELLFTRLDPACDTAKLTKEL
jgi:methionyl-tRNA synthetase